MSFEIDLIDLLKEPNATNTKEGVVKVEKVEGEESPHTVPTTGKLQETIENKTKDKINVSDLTYEQDGLTYLAKLVIEDGQPTIITSEINK